MAQRRRSGPRWTAKEARSREVQARGQKSKDRRTSIQWAENAQLRWTYRLPDPEALVHMRKHNSDRYMVAMLRHEFTNYNELKAKANQETSIPALAIDRLWERVTKMCCSSVRLEFGDGWAWKKGLVGSIAATWAGVKIYIPEGGKGW